jgi:hypothetical protein
MGGLNTFCGRGGGSHAGIDRKILASFFFFSPQWQTNAESSGGGRFKNGSYAPDKHTTANVREHNSDR